MESWQQNQMSKMWSEVGGVKDKMATDLTKKQEKQLQINI